MEELTVTIEDACKGISRALRKHDLRILEYPLVRNYPDFERRILEANYQVLKDGGIRCPLGYNVAEIYDINDEKRIRLTKKHSDFEGIVREFI